MSHKIERPVRTAPQVARRQSFGKRARPECADALTSRGLGASHVLLLNQLVGNATVSGMLRPRRRPARRSVQRFEAAMHESIERVGLTSGADLAPASSGLSQEEASAVYFGNWMRDVNQALVPALTDVLGGPAPVFAALRYMGAKKFGRILTPEQLGYYIPAEHLDSPAGLTARSDMLPGQPYIPDAPSRAPRRPAHLDTPQQDPSPTAAVAAGVIDAPLFAVDTSGVIGFLRRSNLHVERRLELAARAGRNPEGMMHFGAALHSIEDLFAHSNWVEMAVNRVLELNADLLPQLSAEDRRAFTYMPTVDMPAQAPFGPPPPPGTAAARPRTESRPVLSTGSFTGADTLVSLSSELVIFLRTPLGDPTTSAERKEEEQFVEAMLKSASATLNANPGLRQAMREAATRGGAWPGNPLTQGLAEMVMTAPLDQIYRYTRLPGIPDAVKEHTVWPIQRVIRNAVSQQVMQPAAGQIEAASIGASIAKTSLLTALRDHQATQRRQFSAAQQEQMRVVQQVKGTPVAEQQTAAVTSAREHEANLQGTPLPTVAGPTHSQISKDHANSPFFGLAFAVAATAVHRLRERMIDAWAEAHGAAARRHFDFSWSAYPQAGTPEQDAQRDLYHEGRDTRRRAADESMQRGLGIARHGNLGEQPYDLAAMRLESARRLQTAAELLRSGAETPASAASRLRQLESLLHDVNGVWMQRARDELAAAAAGAEQASTGDTVLAMKVLAAELEADSNAVQAATSQPAREALHGTLSARRREALSALAAPTVNALLAAAVLAALSAEIDNAAPAYSGEQRAVLEGRQHFPEHHGPTQFEVREMTLPGLDRYPPALAALLAESRRLLGHPYDDDWWQETVRAHVRRHDRQIATDIAARNSGVAVLRRPGETGTAHGH